MTNEDIEVEEFAPWLIIILTVAGGCLRVLLLDTKGMWLDETFSLWLASHPVSEMLGWMVRIDQHPPLYYLLLHSWMTGYGSTPYDVRLLSVLFGTATIPIVYLIGKRMSGAVMGLAAAVFLAFSPFHIYYAQETRMYTFLTFNVAVAVYALVRLLSDPRAANPIGSQVREYLRTGRSGQPPAPDVKKEFSYQDEFRQQTGWRAWLSRRRWFPIQALETDLAWVTFIVFTAASLLSHNTAVFFLIAVNLFVPGLMLFQRTKRTETLPGFQAPSLGNWVKAHLAIFLLWSPWLSTFIRQSMRVDQEFWIRRPDWDTVTQTLKSFLNAAGPDPDNRLQILWIVYALMLGLGLVYYRRKISHFLFLTILFATPFLGELLISLRRPIFLDRTLIWATLPLFLLLAAGIVQLRFRLVILLVVGILGTINIFSASDYFRFYQKEDWSSPAGYVSLYSEKNDLILFNSPLVQIPFDYYFAPYEKKYLLQVEKHGLPDMFESRTPESRMTESEIPRLMSLLEGHERVWLVYSHNSYSDPTGLIPQTLASQLKLVQESEFRGVQVQLYEAP